MRIRPNLNAIPLFLATLAATAQEPRADRPVFSPGDTWEYEFANKRYAKPGCRYSITVERVTSTNVFARLLYPDGCDVSVTTSYPVPPNSVQRFDLGLNHFHYSKEPYPALDFPLHIGKKWTKKWEWRLNGWAYSDDVAGEVESIEKVITPAGTFDTFRIRLVRQYLGTRTGYQTQSGILEDTFWYAPETKNFVKRVYFDAGWANITRELVSFQVRR